MIVSVVETGSPTDAPAPVVAAPTPVTTTILEDPTGAADVTGASCISWAQGQSHRRLLDSSTVQLCTKVGDRKQSGDFAVFGSILHPLKRVRFCETKFLVSV